MIIIHKFLKNVFKKDPTTYLNSIYVVDDDEDICNLYTKFIRIGLEDYEIKTFCGVLEAMEELAKESRAPKLIVCDIEMPNVNGLEISKLLKEGGHEIPVLHISRMDKAKIAQLEGEFNIISKPIGPTQFLEVILNTMDESELNKAA